MPSDLVGIDMNSCGTYEGLRDYCYKEWARTEGRINYVYVDIKGYPTTGTGELIYAPDGNGTTEQQRQHFQNRFDFTDRNGNHLSNEQKGQFFDRIVADYNAGRLGNDYHNNPYPQYKLETSSMKANFDRKFEAWYEKASEAHPDLLTMPRTLAQTTMHMYWWGKGARANEISSDLPYDKQAEQMYYNVCLKGTQPNAALKSDFEQAIEECRRIESTVTRHEDGSVTYYTDDTKGTRMCTRYPDKNETWYREDDDSKIAYTVDANNFETHYRDDGTTRDYTKDNQGFESHYQGDGATLAYTKDNHGFETHYRDDGTTKDYTKDNQGFETHYQDDGATLSFLKNSWGFETHYQGDGKTVDHTIDVQNGFETYYQTDGITLASVRDREGNETHYQADGTTVDYTKDKDNGEVHYGADDITLRTEGQEAILKDDKITQMSWGDGIKVEYDNAGSIASITDARGNMVRYEGDKVVGVTNADGNKIGKRLFGHHERKEVIKGADEIRLAAADKKNEWQSSTLLASSRTIKNDALAYVNRDDIIKDTIYTDRANSDAYANVVIGDVGRCIKEAEKKIDKIKGDPINEATTADSAKKIGGLMRNNGGRM